MVKIQEGEKIDTNIIFNTFKIEKYSISNLTVEYLRELDKKYIDTLL